MIFTTLPGSIETQSADEAVRALANHIRILQEELEYRLSVLDSSNIASIDATVTPIVTEDGNLLSVLKDDSKYSKLEQTVDGLRSTVSQYGDKVSGYESKMTVFEQTVDGFRGDISRYETAANGYTEEYARLQADISGFRSSVEQYTADVDTYTQQVSSVEQTANSLSARVSAIVSTIGDEKTGVVSAATLAMKLEENESLIQLIADKVDITGVTTIKSTGSVDDTARAVEVANGYIHFLNQRDEGIASIAATTGDEGLWLDSQYGISIRENEKDINVEALGTGTNNGNIWIEANHGIGIYASGKTLIGARENVTIKVGDAIWEFRADGLYLNNEKY